MPRRFQLYRSIDHTGLSGTGIVADGVQWEDGQVVLKWRGDRSSQVHWSSIQHVIDIHGHEGGTKVVWVDDHEDDIETVWVDA